MAGMARIATQVIWGIVPSARKWLPALISYASLRPL